jgi:hypothetical protein
MAQIFHRSTNFIARFSVFSTLFLVGVALVAVLAVARSPYLTRQNISREQPVQFSHKHHVGDDGIDCRYCHTGVETSAVAGIPPTKTWPISSISITAFMSTKAWVAPRATGRSTRCR